ncbi:DUF349 domain-containing protein [Thalassotalea crassostreae]|uniref:DUF349 domain-containing protein n=1 Tax=Thalassotalea crassostreae TaxID=1763536 RepID=UPI000838CAD0|nr:DUF349 domain-containing protein [Thalassotalea crassostreae]
MILDKFFKAKWQSKDANVRVLAINEFSLTAENNEIIKQLIANDPSELVRRTGLIKLNQFDVFIDAAHNNSNNQIKQFARERSEQCILNNEANLQQKKSYLESCNKSGFIEQWLMVEHDHQLIKSILNKVNKPSLLGQYLLKTSNFDLQDELLSRLTDLNLVEKLVKKASDDKLVSKLTTIAKRLKEQAEKPEKLTKEIQLLLSKFLALKEQHDYELVVARRNEIEQQWQTANKEIDCLSTDEQQLIFDKYENIKQQINKHFAPLEEAYRHQQAVAEQKQKQLQYQQQFTSKIESISHQISDAVFKNTDLDQSVVRDELMQLEKDIGRSTLDEAAKKTILEQTKQLIKKLNQLPEVAESVSQATSLISKLSTLALPQNLEELNQRAPVFYEWKAQWKKINELANEILPVSITAARDELIKNWQQALKPLSKEQHELFDHVCRKIAELKRLINGGKYKSAFGLHKKLTFTILDLSASQQQKIEKEFSVVSDKIKELHELESFVVTPRKQQVIEDVQMLVEKPITNIAEQSNKVKEFRRIWNSLGHADEALEHELNAKFNELCELAFAPCREYYAKQGEVRKQHLADKKLLLQQIEALLNDTKLENDESINWRQIDTKLHKLITAWRKVGEVDRDEYESLQEQYKALINPIKQGIHQYQNTNAELKQNIIDKAKGLVNSDDTFSATNELKNLQSKWKTIGFAGPHKDNSLWQSFRKVNDQVFNKRDDVVKQQQQEEQQQIRQLNEQFSIIEAQLNTANTKQELTKTLADFKQLLVTVKTEKVQDKGLLNKITSSIKHSENKLDALKVEKSRLQIQSLFNLFSAIKHDTPFEELTNIEEFSNVSKQWQKVLSNSCKTADDKQREIITLELEILSNTESPKKDQEQRMQVQVQLLTQKLNQGSKQSLEDKLAQWFECGAIGNQLELLERVKGIFIR